MLERILLAIALAVPTAAIAHPPATQPELTQWRTGLVELDEGWKYRDGDDAAWAQPAFDDRAWKTIDIEDIGPAKAGWRWFRLHVNVGPDHANQSLMLYAGEGVYELYVNGQRMAGPSLRSQFAVARPTEQVFALTDDRGDFEIALRTYVPTGYAATRLPLVVGISLGGRSAIGYQRESLQSQRMYQAVPSIAINLLLVLAGLGILALYLSQSTQREYLYLAAYLMLAGVTNCMWHLMQAGILSLALNFLFADPLIYVVSIAQIEFTFSFVRRRLGRTWRMYESILLLPMVLVPVVWSGHFSQNTYNLIQAIVIAPLAIFLPAHLFVWYRRGNREAGWIILPILLITGINVLYDLGLCSFYLGWKRLEFLIDPIPVGPIPIETTDAANVLFLVALGIVMYFRFTRVNREQMRSAAELDAARQIQRQLVPASLPTIDGYTIETAYLPAQEVGGDFYQVLPQTHGSTLVVVGDVSGKGLKAAMKGTLAIGAVRALSNTNLGPSALLARLNEEMLHTQDGGFITCLCAQLSRDGSAIIANAGHLSPYRSGEEIALNSGLPLGIVASAEYSVITIQLRTGDRLTLLSDGVLEARNKSGELFGFERTRAISVETAEKIARSAQQFGQDDDITVLTLTYAG